MRIKSLPRVGFLSILAAIAVLSASDRFAAGAQRVDVIDNLPERAAQQDSDSMKAGDHPGMVAQQNDMKTSDHRSQRVDVIDDIGSEGTVYSYSTKSQRVDVIDSIGSEGNKYSYSK